MDVEGKKAGRMYRRCVVSRPILNAHVASGGADTVWYNRQPLAAG